MPTNSTPTIADEVLVELVKAKGLRVTATRLAILRALQIGQHLDTETVIERVRAQLGSVARQTVYSTLEVFGEAGIVRTIEPAGNPLLHELRVGDNHHHVVCRVCNEIRDISCVLGERPCLTPSESYGYLLDEAEITFWGTCPACLAAQGEIPQDPNTGDYQTLLSASSDTSSQASPTKNP